MLNLTINSKLSVLLLVLAASFEVYGQDTGSISGIIADSKSGSPVEAVIVLTRVLDREAFSRPTGEFVIREVPAGRYTLVFSRDGYLTRILDDVTVQRGNQTSVTVNLEPLPMPETVGNLKDVTELVGPSKVEIGRADTYRIRVTSSVHQPMEYHWDFGDGSYAAGNPVVHKFETAGFHQIVAMSRNRSGWHSDTLFVTTLGGMKNQSHIPTSTPTDASPSTASTRSGSAAAATTTRSRRTHESSKHPGLRGGFTLNWGAGGFVWMLSTHFSKNAAEARMRTLRLTGLRSGVFVDKDPSGKMSTVYRVVVGQFSSPEHAMQSKGWLLNHIGPQLILWEIPKGSTS